MVERRFTIVSFHAHPDDEALLISGTLARAAAEGHRVVIVVATAGEAGLAREDWSTSDLGARRRMELEESRGRSAPLASRCSATPTRAGQSATTSATDPAPFSQLDVEPLAHDLAALLTQEDADVLTIYDERGGYGHPDHVQVHRVGIRAAEIAGTRAVLEATLDRKAISTAVSVLRRLAWILPIPELPDLSGVVHLPRRPNSPHRRAQPHPLKGGSDERTRQPEDRRRGGDLRTLALNRDFPVDCAAVC